MLNQYFETYSKSSKLSTEKINLCHDEKSLTMTGSI